MISKDDWHKVLAEHRKLVRRDAEQGELGSITINVFAREDPNTGEAFPETQMLSIVGIVSNEQSKKALTASSSDVRASDCSRLSGVKVAIAIAKFFAIRRIVW